jgi:tetratricopeptide (TPR) repeat protein
MKATRPRANAPRPPRRWRTPPPLTRGSAETLEGMEILREVGGDAGVLLWQSYRNVMFWATAEPAERAKMFSADAGKKRLAAVDAAALEDALSIPLTVVGKMLASPDKTAGEAVADACTTVARWADAHGYLGTSLAFTQAAALAAPSVARLPYDVAEIARKRHELARAETWYRHAIMIGRQVGDWESYARAYVALGSMFLKRGNFPVAHRMHIKAVRASRRKGLPGIQGPALHDLFIIAAEGNRTAQAQQFASAALRAYGSKHERVPALAHDIGYYWLRQGHYERSLTIFEALLPHFTVAAERIVVLANIARAAGGAGARDVYRKAWTEVNRLARDPETVATLAPSMLDLARGAASLEEWDRAEQAAEQAFKVARERGEAQISLLAEDLLDSVRSRPSQKPASQVWEAAVSHDADADADRLANDMVRSLAMAA